MSMNEIPKYGLAEQWLNCADSDSVGMTTTGLIQQLSTTNCNCLTNYYYPYTYTTYVTEPARPIKLTLLEIERLRKAAKADEALKAILKRFTSQIEVIVDLE